MGDFPNFNWIEVLFLVIFLYAVDDRDFAKNKRYGWFTICEHILDR